MTRALVTLKHRDDRAKVVNLALSAPWGTRFTVNSPRRTIDQNDKMWAMLTEVSEQVKWHEMELSPNDWKLMFMDALDRERGLRVVANLDDTGYVALGRSSSDLSKDEMSDLIELIYAFGAQHGVRFADEQGPSPMKCIECEINYADPPPRLCPGCEAYQEHQR